MSPSRPNPRNPSRLRPVVGLVALGLAAAAGTWLVLAAGEPPPAGEGSQAPGPQPAIREAAPRAPNEFELVLGEAVTIKLASLRGDRPLVLDLPLPVAMEGTEPLEARVYRENESAIELAAALASEGRVARVELDATTLRPGQYLVEVVTREPSHFPVRRYLIELR